MLDTTKDKKTSDDLPRRYLVTNHLNLLHILQAGLVMTPAGFRGKYYTDPLSVMPGWIPLFRDAVPANALKQAVSERSYLRPCIVSFDLSGVSGLIQILSPQGHVRRSSLPSASIERADSGFFIPAPLPLTLLSRIYFQSNEDRQAFEAITKAVSSVNLTLYHLEVSEFLFDAADNVWPPIIATEKMSDTAVPPLKRPHLSPPAVGGMLSMLYHCAKRSELGKEIFLQQSSTESESHMGNTFQDPILAEWPNWLGSGRLSVHANTSAQLYWGVMDVLMATHEKIHPSQSVNVVLEYLDTQLTLVDETFKPSLERLLTDIRTLFSLEGCTVTELLERNQNTVSRALLLFFLRDQCLELLEFSHPFLSDTQYLLAGMLFGARDGWIKQPREMRHPALSAYVMQRMANIAHQQQGNAVSFPEIPSPSVVEYQNTSKSH